MLHNLEIVAVKRKETNSFSSFENEISGYQKIAPADHGSN